MASGPLSSRQLGVLRRAPAFRLLFLGAFGSGIGTFLAAIALTIDVYDRTGSGSWVSALLIADFLPTIAIGLLLGPLIDRLPRKLLMVGADVVRLAAFCALPFAGSAAGIVALAGVVGFANGFFRPAVYACLPNLVEDGDLGHANAIFQTVENATWALGPLLGGTLVALPGPHLAYWINAVTFLVSALLLGRIPRSALQSEQPLTRGHWTDLADGIRVVVGSRALMVVLVAWSIVMFGNASVNVAEVFLAKETLSSGAFGFGLLAAAAGVGLTAGSFAAGGQIERRGAGRIYGLGIAGMALGTAAVAVSPDVWVAAACVTVSGFGNGAAGVCNAFLVQRGAPDALRGRAFTLIMSVNYVFLALAMIAAGPATDAVGARWVWGAAASLFAVAAAVAAVLARGIREPQPEGVLGD
ncbi:MAG: MFS transporter [Gaiellaceae bacterium]